MRTLRLVPILAVAAAGCATLAPAGRPAAVARDMPPGRLAWRILAGVQQSDRLMAFDRDMVFGPGRVRLELTRTLADGTREVLRLRLVPGRSRTTVYASGWREDPRGRTRAAGAAGSLSALIRVVRVAAGRQVAVAGP